MDNHNIIVKPLVTEQGVHMANVKGQYSFEVNKKANKFQIKNAVEKMYSVKVRQVNTANKRGKQRRKGRNMGMTRSWKKAVVFLEKDYHIDLF